MKIFIICSAVLFLALLVEVNAVNEVDADDVDLDEIQAEASLNDEPCARETSEKDCDSCCAKSNKIGEFATTPDSPNVAVCDCPYKSLVFDEEDDDDDDDDEEQH